MFFFPETWYLYLQQAYNSFHMFFIVFVSTSRCNFNAEKMWLIRIHLFFVPLFSVIAANLSTSFKDILIAITIIWAIGILVNSPLGNEVESSPFER